jgi:ABC-type bacteriocin/lantibiotic exporter with double-glycine peptidase domain
MAWPFLAKLAEFNDFVPEHEGGVDIRVFESLKTDGVSVEFDGGRVVTVPDLEIKKGEKVMFFGESGIGKSTVFNIIMGFQVYRGRVLVNGIDLRDISLASLRRVFGITFQHSNAITLDLRGNILLGASMADDKLERLIQLTALESQYDAKGDTILNNKVLSGGEKSRLGLSQTLVTDPDIMLIDEAFSNMDEALESKIIGDLFREYPDRAVICISHRNSSKPFFDRVVEFNP